MNPKSKGILTMDEFFRPIQYNEIFYNDKGKECVDNEHCFAKEIEKVSDQINTISYYILCKMNVIIDPWGEDYSRRKIREMSFKKVTEESFHSYLKYLKTREQRFLTIARRKQYG